MKVLLSALILAATPVLALDVPSGQQITLQEVLVDDLDGEAWLRFRFIAPQISRDGGDVSFGRAESDMTHLCESMALPYMSQYELTGEVIVISFADRSTEFGVPEPDATQFIEVYRIENQTCIWEAL